MKLFFALILLGSPAWADPAHTDYEVVPFSTSTQTLGPVGGSGDVLEKLIIVNSATTANKVYINDGSGQSVIAQAVGAPVGVFTVDLGARSTSGAWKVTTDTSSSVIAVGRFK